LQRYREKLRCCTAAPLPLRLPFAIVNTGLAAQAAFESDRAGPRLDGGVTQEQNTQKPAGIVEPSSRFSRAVCDFALGLCLMAAHSRRFPFGSPASHSEHATLTGGSFMSPRRLLNGAGFDERWHVPARNATSAIKGPKTTLESVS
jgi:hypothetical protein